MKRYKKKNAAALSNENIPLDQNFEVKKTRLSQQILKEKKPKIT